MDLDLIARAIEYPDAGSADAARLASLLAEGHPVLGGALDALAAWLDAAAAGEPEETYTRLFDLSPVCTLHAGYHLFGEAYQRGSLLAGLAEELRKAEVPTGEELPDYLPTLLRLLPRLAGEDRQALGETLLLPALARMATPLETVDHPWAAVVRSLPPLVTELLPAPPVLLAEPSSHALDADFSHAEAPHA